MQKERRAKTRELLLLQGKIDGLFKEVSILQSEEIELQEKGRFMSENEDRVLDAFDAVESRGGGSELVDKSLEAVIPNSEMVLDEWLQFADSDFFGTAEVPQENSSNS